MGPHLQLQCAYTECEYIVICIIYIRGRSNCTALIIRSVWSLHFVTWKVENIAATYLPVFSLESAGIEEEAEVEEDEEEDAALALASAAALFSAAAAIASSSSFSAYFDSKIKRKKSEEEVKWKVKVRCK